MLVVGHVEGRWVARSSDVATRKSAGKSSEDWDTVSHRFEISK